MSLRTNLSTRPFYNHTAVNTIFGVLVVLMASYTTYDGARLYRLSVRHRQLAAAADRADVRAREFAGRAANLRRGIDSKAVAQIAAAAREANDLIDRRTFSWTELFNQLETTLPDRVMLKSIRPRISQGTVDLELKIAARSTEDVDAFMTNLQKSGVFASVEPSSEEPADVGIEAVLAARYAPRPVALPAAAPPAAPRGTHD